MIRTRGTEATSRTCTLVVISSYNPADRRTLTCLYCLKISTILSREMALVTRTISSQWVLRMISSRLSRFPNTGGSRRESDPAPCSLPTNPRISIPE